MPRRLGRRLGTAAALCTTLTSCPFPTAPDLPPGARLLAVPTVYRHWWELTEACSGVTGPVEQVRFFEVPNATDFMSEGRRVVGYWTSAGNEIVLAGDAVLDG